MESTKESIEEREYRQSCEYLCKVIGEAIGDRTISFKVYEDSVILEHIFSSGATMSVKFQSVPELNTYLAGMWDMYLSRIWIRG